MERFVELIVGGGLAMLAGLWAVSLFVVETAPWIAGVALTVLGTGALFAGIWREIDV